MRIESMSEQKKKKKPTHTNLPVPRLDFNGKESIRNCSNYSTRWASSAPATFSTSVNSTTSSALDSFGRRKKRKHRIYRGKCSQSIQRLNILCI